MKDTTVCSSANFEIPIGALFPPEGLQGKGLGIPKLVDKKAETSLKKYLFNNHILICVLQ